MGGSWIDYGRQHDVSTHPTPNDMSIRCMLGKRQLYLESYAAMHNLEAAGTMGGFYSGGALLIKGLGY